MSGDPRPAHSNRRVIVGVGNEFRQDDGAGIVVARRLRKVRLPNATVVESSGEGTALFDILCEAQNVVIVDAMSSQRIAGTIRRINAASTAIPHGLARSSSHSFGVAEAIELARALGLLPGICRVYGIEGKSFDFGNELSTEVASAVEWVSFELAERVGGALALHDATF